MILNFLLDNSDLLNFSGYGSDSKFNAAVSNKLAYQGQKPMLKHINDHLSKVNPMASSTNGSHRLMSDTEVSFFCFQLYVYYLLLD